MSDNSKQVTLNGLFWNAVDRFGNQVVVTIVGIIVARILFPADFAVILALSIFSVIATAVVDSGLATSLVRSQEVSEDDFSTMFGFNMVISTVIYVLLFVSAPYIEEYYGIANLSLYARVMFLQLIVHALGIIQYVKILRQFQFNLTAKTNILSVFGSGLVVVSLALMGFGVWALVIQPLLQSTIRTALFWYWGNWKINLRFKMDSFRHHLGFSLMFMFSNMISKIISPMYYSFIVKNFSQSIGGIYYQANKWGETPNMLITSIIQGTTLSTLAPFQNDYPRFLNACRKTMSTLAFVLFPVSFCVIAIAEPAFVSVLGERYHASVIFFQWITFAGIFMSLSDLNVSFLNIKGKSNITLSLEIFKILFAFVVLLCTYHAGVQTIIYGQVIVRFVFYIISTIYSDKIYGYNWLLQFKDTISPFVISVFCAFIAYLPIYFNLPIVNGLLFILQGSLYFLLYLLINHFIGNAIWIELLQVLKSKLKK